MLISTTLFATNMNRKVKKTTRTVTHLYQFYSKNATTARVAVMIASLLLNNQLLNS